MADPHIQSPMDNWDYLTVIIYRGGFTLATLMVLMLPYLPHIAHLGLLIAAVCCASSLHIYLKSFRLLLQFAAWIGLICEIFNFHSLSLGASFVVLGGLAFKEYFCFRIFLLNLQPLFLAFLWLTIQLQAPLFSQILSLLCGILFALLSVKKWCMPLHFDIGDKTKYQI